MRKRDFLVITILLCLITYCYGAEDANAMKRDILAVPGPNAPPWYNFFYDLSKWPDERNLPKLVDIDSLGYSPEEFLNKAINKGIIDEGWRKNALRVSKLTIGSKRPTDAYLYRQKIEGGFIHICDARDYLGIAFYSIKDVNYLEEPGKNLSEITQRLLNPEYLKDPNGLGFRDEKANGVINGKGWSNNLMGAEAKSFGYCLSRNSAIFVFLKNAGAIHSFVPPEIPFFRSAEEKLSVSESVLLKLNDYEKPQAKDIPMLLELMSTLPARPDTMEEQKAMFEDVKRWIPMTAIDRARGGILRKLCEAVESIKQGGKEEVELIKKALGVDKYLQNTDDNPEMGLLQQLKINAIDALYRITTDDAANLHLQILMQEKGEPGQGLLRGFGMYPLFRERMEAIYEKEKAAGNPVNNSIIYKKFIEDLKRNPIPGVTLTSEKPKNKMLIWIGICTGALLVLVVFTYHLTKKKKVEKGN